MKRVGIVLCTLLVLLLVSCGKDQDKKYVENGNKFFSKGKFKEASIMYRRALQKNPRYGEAYYRLGLTELKLVQYVEAIRALRRAVELQPDNNDASSKLADIYLAAYLSDPKQPKAILKEVQDLTDTLLKRDPKSYDGLRLGGYLALARRDIPDSVEKFRAANQIRPLQPELVLALYQALVANNNVEEADTLAKGLIAKEKTFAPIYDVVYRTYISQKRMEDAEKILRLKVDNNPKQGGYLLQLAAFYYAANRRADMEKVIEKLSTDSANFPGGKILAGDFFFRVREFPRAEQFYQDGTRTAQGKEKLPYQKRLVELYAVQGKNSEANQAVEAILKEDPKDVDGIGMRAALLLQTGNREQIQMAVNDLQALVQRMPDNHLLHYNLGRALLTKGDIDPAILQFQDSIKLRPDFTPAKMLLSQAALTKRDFSKSLQFSTDVLNADPNNMQAHLVHSNSLLGLGEKEKARLELQQVLAAKPDSADARYQMGYLDFMDGKYQQAAVAFKQVHDDHPGDSRGLIGIVETEVAQKDYSQAIRTMQSELQKDPKRNDYRLALANIMVRGEQYDPAIKEYKTLIDLNPKSSDLYLKIGETYRRKGDLNAAIDSFRKANQLAPNDPNPLQLLALLLEGTGKRDQARPIYEQILRIQPDNAPALNNLAYMKAEEGIDLDQALTLAQRARQKVPNSSDIADTLGWIYIKKNLSDEAVRIFKGLVEKDPKNPTYRYHLAMALYQKGDKPTAKRELEEAARNGPSQDVSGKIKDLMQKVQ